MKLQTFAEVEHSVGVRPKVENTKVRMSFNLSRFKAEHLRALAESNARPVSQMVRIMMSEYLTAHPAQK